MLTLITISMLTLMTMTMQIDATTYLKHGKQDGTCCDCGHDGCIKFCIH